MQQPMIMTAAAQAPITQSRWIINRREDLTWFIGSALAGYAAIALLAAGVPTLPILLVWILGIDGPHVVATATRTYFDPEERGKLGPLLWAILPCMLAGPMCVYLGYGSWFYLVALTWQALHVSKQHFGFAMLYRAKVRERDGVLLDKLTILAGMMIPFARYVLLTFNLVPAEIVGFLDSLLIALYVALIVWFTGRQIQLWRQGKPVNIAKLLLVAAALPLPWVAFYHALPLGKDGLVRLVMASGLFHAVQYHRLILFHNRNRYTDDRAPMASFFSKNLLAYAALAVGGSAMVFLLGRQSQYLAAAVWGVAFTHYVLDSRIWRVRGDKQLAAALRLA
jgi:hypothetical protein